MPSSREPPRDPVKPVPSPQTLNPEIPSVLSRLVMQACSYRRTDRPHDMKQVINKLEMCHHVLAKRRESGVAPATLSDDRGPSGQVPNRPAGEEGEGTGI